MKRVLFFLFSAVLVLISCQPNPKESAGNDTRYEDLLKETHRRDSAMMELMKTLNLIDENIGKISERQENIDLHANDVEFKVDDRERLLDEIQQIFEMMQQNKKRIDDLNARLENSRTRLKGEAKENKRLSELLDQYQIMINNLNIKLEGKDKEIFALKEQLAKMDISLDSLKAEVESKHAELNKVYYAFGTKKELMNNNVIDKKGGFIGLGKSLHMKSDFNKSYFTEASAEMLKEIDLMVKEARLLSTHRDGSYHFTGEGKVNKLVIDKPDLFWEASKYLVIEVVPN